MALSRKGAKSRTHGRKLRSTGTKARTRVAASGASQAALIKKLKTRASDLEKKLDTRTHDLAEAREQQTATSKVLQVISSSPGELEPVFMAMLENATRICEANFGILYRVTAGALSDRAARCTACFRGVSATRPTSSQSSERSRPRCRHATTCSHCRCYGGTCLHSGRSLVVTAVDTQWHPHPAHRPDAQRG